MRRAPRFGWLPGWLRGRDSTEKAAADSAQQRKKAAADSAKARGPAAKDSASAANKNKAKAKSAKDSVTVLDFHVELETSDGVKTSVALADLSPLPPPLTIRLYKWARSERKYGAASRDYDQVLTRYAIPLGDLERKVPGFSAAKLRTVRFVFDRSDAGTVLIDGIGFER
jgi:hypothetical protein